MTSRPSSVNFMSFRCNDDGTHTPFAIYCRWPWEFGVTTWKFKGCCWVLLLILAALLDWIRAVIACLSASEASNSDGQVWDRNSTKICVYYYRELDCCKNFDFVVVVRVWMKVRFVDSTVNSSNVLFTRSCFEGVLLIFVVAIWLADSAVFDFGLACFSVSVSIAILTACWKV